MGWLKLLLLLFNKCGKEDLINGFYSCYWLYTIRLGINLGVIILGLTLFTFFTNGMLDLDIFLSYEIWLLSLFCYVRSFLYLIYYTKLISFNFWICEFDFIWELLCNWEFDCICELFCSWELYLFYCELYLFSTDRN